MTAEARIWRLRQDQELPVQVVRRQAFAYRMAYARSSDTRVANDVGQDYLVVLESEQMFVFALCDGVSQSFFGDLAARYLGDALVEWLSNELPPTMDIETCRRALTDHLQSLIGPATEEVQHFPLPTDIPPMLRDVLEEKRSLGSESTFVCGRIDWPSDNFPTGRVVLAWMGDSRLRVWSDDDQGVDLGGVFDTAQRWSTRRGLVGGELNAYIAPLKSAGHSIKRLMAYSDGLVSMDRWERDPSNYAVQEMITRAGESATSDDISFLEVWLGEVPAHIEETLLSLSAPVWLDVGVRDGHVRAAWRRVSGARRYEVKISDGETKIEWTTGTNWESPVMPAGDYRLRVRAWGDEAPGQWSKTDHVTVPQRPTASEAATAISKGTRSAPPVLPMQESPFKIGYIGMAAMFLLLGCVLTGLMLRKPPRRHNSDMPNGTVTAMPHIIAPPPASATPWTPTWSHSPTRAPMLESPLPLPASSPLGPGRPSPITPAPTVSATSGIPAWSRTSAQTLTLSSPLGPERRFFITPVKRFQQRAMPKNSKIERNDSHPRKPRRS